MTQKMAIATKGISFRFIETIIHFALVVQESDSTGIIFQHIFLGDNSDYARLKTELEEKHLPFEETIEKEYNASALCLKDHSLKFINMMSDEIFQQKFYRDNGFDMESKRGRVGRRKM